MIDREFRVHVPGTTVPEPKTIREQLAEAKAENERLMQMILTAGELLRDAKRTLEEMADERAAALAAKHESDILLANYIRYAGDILAVARAVGVTKDR